MGHLSRQAEALSRIAHHGQTDKAGAPYVEHPARVAARVQGDDAHEAVAWLHDVVEDTGITLADLREQFPAAVVNAVDALTKRSGEPPSAYYDRVAANPIARRVKLADLADNSDPERLALLDAPTRERLQCKYATGRARLGATGN